jgi:hypothetical protein
MAYTLFVVCPRKKAVECLTKEKNHYEEIPLKRGN